MLTVINHRAWMSEYLSADLSLGMDLPDTEEMIPGRDGIWCPGHYASLYHLRGDDWTFDDAPDWWTLPGRLLGREVTFVAGRPEIDGDTFVKSARHKVEAFPAAVYDPAGLDRALDAVSDPEGRTWLLCDPVDYRSEYRFWVIGGEVRAGACYRDGEWWWDGEAPGRVPEEATRFASEVADEFPACSAYTLDVGVDTNGRWSVVETNPAWCSGFYGVDPEVISEAVVASQGRERPVEAFVPDCAVADTLSRHRLLRAL